MILIVAGEFPPIKTIGRLRTAKFVEHLRDDGWEVAVLTVSAGPGEPGYDAVLEGEVPSAIKILRANRPDMEEQLLQPLKQLLGRERRSAVSKVDASADSALVAQPPSPTGSANGAGLVARQRAVDVFKWVVRNWVAVPDDYRAWAVNAQKLAERFCSDRKVDLVFTSLPPFSAARIGYALKTKFDIPWIIDYRDLWYGDVLREWIGPVRRRFELLQEKRYVRAADAVVAVSRQKTDFLRTLHRDAHVRWETLTNGYDPDIYARFLGEARLSDDTVDFVFTGRLFKNRRGYAFAEALGQLAREDVRLRERARVHILGGVSAEIRSEYNRILARYDITEMYRFAGDVPYEAAMRAQVNADYLLLIVDTGATSDGVIPGKLFEYVAARRPIFALTDAGATQEIIERGRLGSVVPAESVEHCKAALRDWLARPVPAELDADWTYLEQFERRSISRRLGALFAEVISAPNETKKRTT